MPLGRCTPRECGFTLIEVLVSMTVLLVIGGAAVGGLLDVTRTSDAVTGRTDMRTSLRNAIDLMADEVGQAGRVTVPSAVTTTGSIGLSATTVTVSSVSQMFVGERLVLDGGANQETVTVSAISGNRLTFEPATKAHVSGVPVTVPGGIPEGVVHPSMANGSSGSRLKIVGDLFSDGSLNYGEYWCDFDSGGLGRLYRLVVPFNQAQKPAVTAQQILVENLQANPGGDACFTYQTKTVGDRTYVTDVGIMLSIASQATDRTTAQRFTENRVVLNIAPRNILAVRRLALAGVTNRIQPFPTSVVSLLP